jgi:hypothetical protein
MNLDFAREKANGAKFGPFGVDTCVTLAQLSFEANTWFSKDDSVVNATFFRRSSAVQFTSLPREVVAHNG